MLDIMFTVLFSKSVAKPTEGVTTSKLALNELLISGVVSERFPVEMICVDNEMMSVDGKSVQVEAFSIPVIKDSVE